LNSVGEISPTDTILKDTEFTLTGDLFAEHFGLERKISTPVFQAVAVQAQADTAIIRKEFTNMSFEDMQYEIPEGDLGGSGPIDITFTAYGNEPTANSYAWRLRHPKLTPVTYYGKEFRYEFKEEGKYTVTLEVGNEACVDSTKTFNITISDFYIKIPNAFSPGGSPGVNDEFKIAFRSIAKFRGWIFSQWGNQLYYWEDPTKGWDGKVRGKVVPTGVYYFVCEVKTTDGKSRKFASDVNVIRSK